MDTKLKNTKTKTMKIVALVLAAVMFFASGTFASLFLRGFFNYNIFSHPENVTQTTSFRMGLNEFIWDIIDRGFVGQYSTYEDFLTSAEASLLIENYATKSKDVAAAHDLLDKAAIDVYRDAQNRYRYSKTFNGVTYRFSYNGEVISNEAFGYYEYVLDYENSMSTTVMFTEPSVTSFDYETNNGGEDVTRPIAYPTNNEVFYNPHGGGNVPKEISQISNALETLFQVGEYTCYGESTKEAILAVVESNKEEALKSRYNDKKTTNWQHSYIDSNKNINYAIVFKNGSVFTNCGVTSKDTREQVIQKLGNPVFAECNEGGKYSVIAGKGISFSDNIYSTVYNMIFGPLWNESDMNTDYFTATFPDIDNIYISYNENALDVFSIISAGFNRYNGNYSLTWLVVLFALSLIIAYGAGIYYLTLTGKTENGVRIHFYDKIPFEINWALALAVMAVLVGAVVEIFIMSSEPVSYVKNMGNSVPVNAFLSAFSGNSSLITGACTSLFFMVWFGAVSSVVRNLRNKTFTKYSIIFLIFRPVKILFKWCKKQLNKAKEVLKFDYTDIKGKKFRIISVIAVVLFAIITMTYYWIAGIEMSNGSEEIGFILSFLGIIGDGLIVTYVILSVLSLDRIRVAVSAVRKGEINSQIETKYMPPFMKQFADDVIGVRDGLQNAVESAVKDQRMKAELITNVSHDLKTPLTSIVNYVDLLKKCEIQDETAQKYVGILDEKAQRMKKLVEDLVEASKASSGAIEIHTVKLNLCEFAAQMIGENSDELRKYDIELVMKAPETPVMVDADAQKVSRIAENLFSNIRKYALQGTRVYVEVTTDCENGLLTFKNISKNPLDISPDELTQRFVRGDSSRSGEGSGLGLSIAKDLCELQRGRLAVQIDGDLFKASVLLPLSKA